MRPKKIYRNSIYNKDILTKKFGKLIPLERVEAPEHIKNVNGTFWKCKCDCGNEIRVSRSNLISGSTKSCGCIPNRTIMPNKQHCKNIIYSRYTQRCRNSKRKGLFLTKEQVIELSLKSCHYCGLDHSNIARTKYESLEYNGLDRIDNSKGYSLDNVVTCCKFCNALRSDTLTQEETKKIIDFIKYLRDTKDSPWKESLRYKINIEEYVPVLVRSTNDYIKKEFIKII